MAADTNARAAEAFGARVKARTRQMVAKKQSVFEKWCIAVALNLILGGRYSPGTPIATGFAQNSWVVGLDTPGAFRQPPQPPPEERDVPVTVVSFEEAVDTLRGVPLGAIVHFSSNCIYIRKLEYGHSDQAPEGFLRITIAAAKLMLRDAESEDRAMTDAARGLRNA